MTDEIAVKPPTWYWIVAVLALLWTLLGCATYVMQAYGLGAGMEAGMTDAQRTLDASMPAWVTGAYAIAVFAGALGCIGLLIRKRWAKMLLLVSLVAALAQQFWVFALSDAIALLGSSAAILPICVILIAIATYWFASHADKKGWLG